MVTRMDIVRGARQWIGTPYAHAGRDIGARADCICVPLLTARSLGLTDFDITGYSRRPGTEDILALCRARPELEEIARLEVGALVIMAWHEGGRYVPTHFGVVGDYPETIAPGEYSVIHAWAVQRKVVEHRIDPEWLRRIVAQFRFREAA